MPTDPKRSSSQNFVERWKGSSRRAHALLLSGPEGSGKLAAAEAVASDVLKDVLKSDFKTHPDLIRVAPEKNAIKIEAVREIISRLAFRPVQAERIVVLIEEADAMTIGAANALLKTLEEPPPYVLFLLLTSRPEELPATIRSRCQRVRFQVPAETLRRNLEEQFASWDADLGPLWTSARSPFSSASRLAEAVKEDTERIYPLLDLLKALWHDAAVLKSGGGANSLLVPAAQRKLEGVAGRKTPDQLFEELDLVSETERALDGNVNKALALERLFYRLIG